MLKSLPNILLSLPRTAVDFFNELSLIWGIITDIGLESVPAGAGFPPGFEYRWTGESRFKNPPPCSGPQYVEYVMAWVDTEINKDSLFPTSSGKNSSIHFRIPELHMVWRKLRSFKLSLFLESDAVPEEFHASCESHLHALVPDICDSILSPFSEVRGTRRCVALEHILQAFRILHVGVWFGPPHRTGGTEGHHRGVARATWRVISLAGAPRKCEDQYRKSNLIVYGLINSDNVNCKNFLLVLSRMRRNLPITSISITVRIVCHFWSCTSTELLSAIHFSVALLPNPVRMGMGIYAHRAFGHDVTKMVYSHKEALLKIVPDNRATRPSLFPAALVITTKWSTLMLLTFPVLQINKLTDSFQRCKPPGRKNAFNEPINPITSSHRYIKQQQCSKWCHSTESVRSLTVLCLLQSACALRHQLL